MHSHIHTNTRARTHARTNLCKVCYKLKNHRMSNHNIPY